MVSYTAPVAPTLPHAVGLDAEIQRLQLLLTERLPWLAVSYGKAYRAGRVEGKKTIYYPEVYHGAGEYRDVLPNDNVAAQSFFYPRDPATTGAQEPSALPHPFTQVVDYVFWANLRRLDAEKDYRYDTELLHQVLAVFSGEVLVQRVYTSPEEVFRGFSVDTVAEQVLRQPYCGFRIQLELYVVPGRCAPAPEPKTN